MSAGSLLCMNPNDSLSFTNYQKLDGDSQTENLQLSSSLNSTLLNEQQLPSILEEEQNKNTPLRSDCSFISSSTTVQTNFNEKVKFEGGYLCDNVTNENKIENDNIKNKSNF